MKNTFGLLSLILGLLRCYSCAVNVTCNSKFHGDWSPLEQEGLEPCLLVEFPVTSLGRRETYNYRLKYAQPNDIQRVGFGRTTGATVSVDFIPAGIFTVFPNMLEFDMTTNLTELRAGDFTNAMNLTTLLLFENQITEVRRGVFSSGARLRDDVEYPLHKLTGLALDSNRIADIEPNSFSGLNRLEWLNLQLNELTAIERNTFVGLPRLRSLELSRNKIDSIEEGAFELPSLDLLNLSFNRLKRLRDGAFAHLPKLRKLNLNRNGLIHIGQSMYNLSNIDTIALQDNEIVDIDFDAFARLPKLRKLKLDRRGNDTTSTAVHNVRIADAHHL